MIQMAAPWQIYISSFFSWHRFWFYADLSNSLKLNRINDFLFTWKEKLLTWQKVRMIAVDIHVKIELTEFFDAPLFFLRWLCIYIFCYLYVTIHVTAA